ncbi:MAG: DUF4105 domain-containing protein [Proteobacteria bacterium]|nr:DUF4105 domain-containing protein [Pseudomonadota bacterium]
MSAFLAALLAVAVVASPVRAEGDHDGYSRELIARAHAMGLAESSQWLRLGHWKASGWSRLWFIGALSGWQSEADGGDFFLARNGKSSPSAELNATLRAFTRPTPAGDEHAICRFPARFRWLHRQLRFDRDRLAAPRCGKFEAYLKSVKPKSAIVVFSSYFLSKAASAFGHTFLRIEKDEPHAGTERRQLLDTGIDYSATVTTSNALIYGIMGMIGGFRGTFRKLPYYYKVREYNDFDTRDIWEYRLDLSDEQLFMLVAHLWELGSTYFDYFYFTENCSYHILGAIEAARPDIELLSGVKSPVIPADTIKALFSVPGLVVDVAYRPSLMTQFRHRVEGMSDVQLDTVEKLVEAPDSQFPDSMTTRQRIQVLDAAADLVDIKYSKTLLVDLGSEPSRLKLRLLERRARIGQPSADVSVAIPWHKQPHVGHGSRRIGIGAGTMRGADEYLSLQLRVTLHDLADPAPGYPELSQIEFLPFELRYFPDRQRLRFERASLVRIVHLNSQGRFNRRISWKVDVGGTRIYDRGCDGCFVGVALVGGGIAKSLSGDRVALFTTLDTYFMAGPDLNGIEDAPIRLGIGPAAGVRVRFTERLLTVVAGDWIWLPAQTPLAMWSASGTLRWAISRNFALDVSARTIRRTYDGRLAAMFYY